MNSTTLSKPGRFRFKSRLAGFFLFLCLLSCQEPPTEEQRLLQRAATDGNAASELARRRLAADDLPSALDWWRAAAVLNAEGALQHALMLQQRLEGKRSTAQWLAAQVQVDASMLQPLPAALLAELGFWQHSVLAVQPEPQQCQLNIQPVVATAAAERSYRKLHQHWQQDPQLASLPVCFLPVLRIHAAVLNCSEQPGQRIQCDYRRLGHRVQQGQFQQLLIIGGRGVASFNNGIMQLPEQADLALLRHEFLHIAGFLDEYALAPVAARMVCKAGRIAPNLLVGDDNSTLQRYLQRYPAAAATLELTPVDTCQAVGIPAYRPIATLNSMRHYEADLPPLYLTLLQQELMQSERLMPVQYYFAYLARQNEAWQQWYSYMQLAADFGYPPAIQALASLAPEQPTESGD